MSGPTPLDGRMFGRPRRPDAGPAVRVLLDGLAIGPQQRGLGRFQARLAGVLAARADVDLDVLVTGSPMLPDGATPVAVRGRWQLERDLLHVPRQARAHGGVFVTTTDRLGRVGTPSVVYVFEHPGYRTRMARMTGAGPRKRLADAVTRRLFRTTLRRADRLVAASTSTARDLVFLEGVDPGRIDVAPPGPLLALGDGADAEREPIVLTFIDADPRDNGAVAIEASALALVDPWRLHVVGDPPASLRRTAEEVLGDRVHFEGRVDDDDLRALYRRASAYLDVSLYEGFGGQAAEARAAGLVLVVAAVTSLPEVAGEAATLVDPHDAQLVAGGLQRALASPTVGPAPTDAWSALADHLVALVGELR